MCFKLDVKALDIIAGSSIKGELINGIMKARLRAIQHNLQYNNAGT